VRFAGERDSAASVRDYSTELPPLHGSVFAVEEASWLFELVLIESVFPERPNAGANARLEPRHDLLVETPVSRTLPRCITRPAPPR
jgi:hypothetical protein